MTADSTVSFGGGGDQLSDDEGGDDAFTMVSLYGQRQATGGGLLVAGGVLSAGGRWQAAPSHQTCQGSRGMTD